MNPFFLQVRQHSLTSTPPPSLLHVKKKPTIWDVKQLVDENGTKLVLRLLLPMTRKDQRIQYKEDGNVKHEWDEHTETDRMEVNGVSLLRNEREQRSSCYTNRHFLNGLLGDPLPYLLLCSFSVSLLSPLTDSSSVA